MAKEILKQIDHRPWALPKGPWIMHQTWHDLLFAHWAVSPDALRKHIPNELSLDTFDNKAWIGLVPFKMTNVRPRLSPNIPGCSTFLEMNVRTYVTFNDKAGVYFFSLDAESRLAVEAARWLYHLPYFYAAMSMECNDTISYTSVRKDPRSDPLKFRGNYQSKSDDLIQKNKFDEWLTERYCLFTLNGQRSVLQCDIHHKPWSLQNAELEILENSMFNQLGLNISNQKPVLHFSKKLDVLIWPLKKASSK